jgi:chemotaxis protein CheD
MTLLPRLTAVTAGSLAVCRRRAEVRNMTLTDKTHPVIYLKMGEIAFANRPAIITTVLGSCVAVTLFDRKSGYGSMCHGVMPSCISADRCEDACTRQGHYVDCSVLAMASRFRIFGIRGADIEARVFGGAALFSPTSRLPGTLLVGSRNIEAALHALRQSGIAALSELVGGRAGCRIYFNTRTGEVTQRRFGPAAATDGEHAA